MRGVEQASASIPAPLSSHIQLTLAPVGLWEKFLSKFFPRYYALRAMSKRDLSHLSNEELVQRMHSALQAGEGDFSAFIAQELARRRVHLYGEEGPAPAGSAPLREGGFRREPQSSVGGVRRSGPASGVMHRRGVSAASVDSSFVVPDFLSR
ncbi:unnamed protein product [Trypanosoma congolense IL3000]|nr:unnamed protein product [Trypanosoma congolense IL3000]